MLHSFNEELHELCQVVITTVKYGFITEQFSGVIPVWFHLYKAVVAGRRLILAQVALVGAAGVCHFLYNAALACT